MRRATRREREQLEADPELWLYVLFPSALSRDGELIPLAPHHRDALAWSEQIAPGEYVPPAVWLWARGGAKSTIAEMIAIRLGALRRRRYALYISETQDRADEHVDSIGSRLESPLYAQWYPEMSGRLVNKYGQSKGWRRSRLRARNGFTVDALGLDTAIRGARIDDDRPDLIILDDVDGQSDSPLVTERKLATISRAILPARAPNAAVIFVQNVIRRGSIADRLSVTDPDHPRYTDILADRVVSGPIPALHGVRRVLHRCDQLGHDPCDRIGTFDVQGVTRGVHRCADRHPRRPCRRNGRPAWVIDPAAVPTWEGQDIDECEQQIATMGLEAWLDEAQHEIDVSGDFVFAPPFSRELHAWRRELPPFVAIFGGLDFGGARLDAHHTAGMVGGLSSAGRLVRVGEFLDRGPGVQDRHLRWMREMERTWALPLRQRITWVGDGSQTHIIEAYKGLRIYEKNARSARFDIAASDRGAGSVQWRINLVNRRLQVQETGEPASFYDPRRVTRWPDYAERLAWKPAEPGKETVQREPVKRDDDITDADLYMHEAIDRFLGRSRRRGRRGKARAGG